MGYNNSMENILFGIYTLIVFLVGAGLTYLLISKFRELPRIVKLPKRSKSAVGSFTPKEEKVDIAADPLKFFQPDNESN